MHDALSAVSVYVVEDSPLVLRHLVALVELGAAARVVGTTDAAIPALQEIAALEPDVVLVDMHLRVGSGIDVLAGISVKDGRPMKIALTNQTTPAMRCAARAAGADYFYDKTSEFMLAITRIWDIARERSMVSGQR